MPVSMMRIRVMLVRMRQRLVPMTMPVAHISCNGLVMDVLVMRVVLVLVFMLHGFMIVLVNVPFR